jgi:2-amino-4-hydroxy-6-hydroxymethyldihydropteridine diphosphokinase
MKSVVLSLGSNLGNRQGFIHEMEAELRNVLTPPFKISRLMETEPVGVPDIQPWYLNCIVMAEFGNSPQELLSDCRSIEKKLGRTKKGQLSARTADIDILLFGDDEIITGELVVPHPELTKRRFCLEGLREIAPERSIPGLNKTVNELFDEMEPSVRNQRVGFISDH